MNSVEMPLAVIPAVLALLALAGSMIWDSSLLAWLGGMNLIAAAVIYLTGED